jgi:hypothetical protein
MARPSGSKNKVNKELAFAAEFETGKTVIKTEVYELMLSKGDIDKLIREKAKIVAGFDKEQPFEDYKVIYKKGDAYITLVNPLSKIMVEQIKSEQP